MKIQNAFRLGLVGTLCVGLGILIITSILHLTTVLTYIGVALFLSLGLEPLVALLERRKVPRWASLVIVFVVVVGIFGGVISALVPVLITQITALTTAVTSFLQNGTSKLDWYVWLSNQFPAGTVDNAVQQLIHFIQNNVGGITNGVFQIGVQVIGGFFGTVIVIILVIYFTASMRSIKRGLYQLVPASRRPRFIDITEQITESVGRYVIGQVSLALINGILSIIFLSIIHAPFPILLAVIAFIGSLIPLVGTLSGSVIIVVFSLLLGSPFTAVVAAIYYLVYMQVEAYLFSPRIMNRAVSIPGAVVVVAALAGGSLLGVLGALIAIPVAAAILLIIRQVVVPRQNEL